MRRNTLYLASALIFIFGILFYCIEESINPFNFISNNKSISDSKTLLTEFEGKFNYLPISTTNQVVKHHYYILSYSESYEQAEWVAYELTKDQIVDNNFQRPYFIRDPLVKTRSADWRSYIGSGYDRGHLCPAADREFSIQAYDETFYTSNISPQLPAFNAGIWVTLEQKVRYWGKQYDTLYIVTGGVLSGDLKTIGTERIAVPKYFYKIIFNQKKERYKMIAFLIPHKETLQPIYDFVVSVDSIEKLTGIDFFPALPDDIEDRLEKSSSYAEWIK